MEAEITLGRIISKDELLDVYRAFCQCYDIRIDEIDERRFLLLHYDIFIKEGHLDHRPFMGAKFFGSGRNVYYKFHGYNDRLPEQESSGHKFKEIVESQFSKSPK